MPSEQELPKSSDVRVSIQSLLDSNNDCENSMDYYALTDTLMKDDRDNKEVQGDASDRDFK
jgi:hypothetical protein